MNRVLRIMLLLICFIVPVISSVSEAAYVQSCSFSSNLTGTTLSCTLTGVASGAVIAVFGTWDGTSASLVSCTDGTNSYTIVQTVQDLSNAVTDGDCYAKNVSAGTFTVTMTISVTKVFRRMAAIELSGRDLVSPLDCFAGQNQQLPGSGTDAVTSGTCTTTVDGADIVSSVMPTDSTDITMVAGTGFTLRENPTPNSFRAESRTQTIAGSVAGTWSNAEPTTDATTLMMAFSPDVGLPIGSRLLLGVGK